MIKYEDGVWIFETPEEALAFHRELSRHAGSMHVDSQPRATESAENEQRPHAPEQQEALPQKTKPPRRKPSSIAEQIPADTLLAKYGLSVRKTHEVINDILRKGAEAGNPWYTNKDLGVIAQANYDDTISSIDITYGLAYLLQQGLIEEHPEDVERARNNRYAAL